MINLTPTQRRALKARAHHLRPVVMVGESGLTPPVIREIAVNLKSHELIKIRVLGDARDARRALIDAICTCLDAAPVQHIGKILVIFRPRSDDGLPAARGIAATAKPAAGARRPRAKQKLRRTKRSFQQP